MRRAHGGSVVVLGRGHVDAGNTWVQLAAQGPGGVPLVTVRSAGDLSLEAPDGTLRVHAQHVEHHVTGDRRCTAGRGTT